MQNHLSAVSGSMTNGRVIMIAALSPAAICYDESMSTLRFAERIKQVRIKVSKNVILDPVADIKKAMEVCLPSLGFLFGK